MRIHTFIKRIVPLIACFLIATAGTCDGIPTATSESAERGVASSQLLMGHYYSQGERVPQDYKEAVKWYRKAADQGYADAQYNLGVAYGNGEGVPKNTATAYAWFNVSAANGNEVASQNRDLVAKEMTPGQIAEAQTLSAKWFEKYQP